MPRHPDVAASVAAVPGSVYTALAHRLATHPGPIYPLHVGDTWMEPAPGCRMEDLTIAEHPGMHRYAAPQGLPELLAAIAALETERTGVATGTGSILVTAGATGGLGAAIGALVDPGEEVLIPAPHWPLIAGIARSFHARPVVVPFFGRADSAASAVELLAEQAGPRTAALYLNSPNNPTGRVLPRSWIESLVGWAVDRGLWILSDEVYEDYVYRGEHVGLRSLAPERTLGCHSFSKAFGMAGNRCGYVAGPAEVIGELKKVSTHTFYATPTASQLAAVAALAGPGWDWVRAARERYRTLGRAAAERLGEEPPEGSTFLFLDVAERLDERGLAGFLEDCVDRGLFLAPGESFGPYPTSVRLCFTAAAPDRVIAGVEILAEILGR